MRERILWFAYLGVTKLSHRVFGWWMVACEAKSNRFWKKREPLAKVLKFEPVVRRGTEIRIEGR